MPNTNTDNACPNLNRYQQLVCGQLPDNEKESILSHLENCDACVQKVKTLPEPDTLVGMLRQADTLDEETPNKAIAQLVERLSKLRPAGVKGEVTIDQPPLTPAAPKPKYDFLAAPQAPDEIGRLGPYRILDVLGTGGMGVVFRAEDPQLARQVALKAMLPGFVASETARERFLREARAAAAIKHDHIVSIYQVGEDRGVLFLAMELLDGEPLDARLHREGKLPAAEVVRIGRQIAVALAAAHKRGMIHRDIKPANIWLESETNRIKILDFGLARAAGEKAQLTQQGAIVGTPAYMAPEQGKGKEIDHRCDLFSLGCVLYRMATGEAPFHGTDVVSTLLSVATETPRPPRVVEPRLPKTLSDLIVNLLAKEASDRPASAQVVVEELDRIAQELARPEPAKPRRWWPAVAAAAAFLAVLASGAVYYIQTPDGVVRIEIDDPEIKLTIDGHTATITNADKEPITLKPGKRNLTITRGKDFTFNTASFELPKRGKTVLKITWHPGEKIEVKQDGKAIAAMSLDPDRRAAEWVLLIGGTISIKENDQERQLGAAAALPKGLFELTVVNVIRNSKVSDAGLANFKDCKNLTSLDLAGTKVSDAGLVHFKDCKNLTELILRSTPVGDAGLAHFQDCKKLTSLDLAGTKVSDAGLVHFKDCKNLSELHLNDSPVSDAGLAHFKDCKNFTYLHLNSTQVGDAGLAHFKDCKNVTKLVLHHTNVSDAGLAYFKDYKNLTYADLHATQVGDAGLAHLKDCKSLTILILAGTQVSDAGLERLSALAKLGAVNVTKTKVTEAAVKKLLAALPLCKIESDHGTFGPAADADRRAAEYVLSIAGPHTSINVTENGNERNTRELPSGAFELTGVILQHNQKVTDAGLANFKDCKNLTLLHLGYVHNLSDAGLAHFKDCKKLTALYLAGATDAGLAHFKDCKDLTILSLHGVKLSTAGLAQLKHCSKNLTLLQLRSSPLTNIGLAQFQGCQKLTKLDLADTGVNPAELVYFKDCKDLTHLDLDGSLANDTELGYFKDCKNLTLLNLKNTKVSDKGLAPFMDCKDLEHLVLDKTSVSQAGIALFNKALPQCNISWDGGLIQPNRFTNTLGMKFALVPKGKAWLGGGGGEPGDKEVEFKDDFYLGVYEVTQEEWENVMGNNPSIFKAVGGFLKKDQRRFPVESISWDDAQIFLAKLNERITDPAWTYRLPTSAEWEYACRGGPQGNKLQSKFDYYLKEPGLELMPGQANFRYKDSLERTCKVGSYQPNALGLYDLHGNVWEWCADEAPPDPIAPKAPLKRLACGGSWGDVSATGNHRAASAFAQRPEQRDAGLGLRVARVHIDPNRYKNSLGMEFALVPKGKAWLGGGGGKVGDKEVEFKDDFYLGVYEVTQEEWQKMMGKNPSHFSRLFSKAAFKDIADADLKRFPVESVSWDDCQEFVARLNENLKEKGWVYRLPTEAEWEYACRGGPMPNKEDYGFDFDLDRPTNTLLPDKANFADTGLQRPGKVGSYPANRLGLYDMHGNVWEWCDDTFAGKPQAESPGLRRAVRGGSWRDSSEGCRAAQSAGWQPSNLFQDRGLRVARVRIGSSTPPSFAAAPFDEKQAKAYQESWAKHLGRKVVEDNSLGMKMMLIPPGKFLMGSPENDKQAVNGDYQGKPAEKPQHAVELTRPYVIAAHEVTQEQFDKIMGRNPSAFSAKGLKAKEATGLDTGKLPVEMVSWYDAIEFCNKLSLKEGKQPYYELSFAVRGKDGAISTADVKELGGAGYRLPTEAEWEHACRAGTQSPYSFEFTFATNKQYGWFGYDSGRPHGVGERKPNAFGLFDMHGNVFEYCYDWLGDYPASAVQDPRGPSSGSDRLVRGGSWNYLTQYSRSAFRQGQKPGSRYETTGFRVVHSAPMAVATIVAADPDRRAAEWVLSIGGKIQLVKGGNIATAKDLPAEAIQVFLVSLNGNSDVSETDLVNLKDLAHLRHLYLGRSPVTNAGLRHLTGCKNLTILALDSTKVGDAGLASLKNFAYLKELSLHNTQVSDVGMIHLKDRQSLISLDLSLTQIGDAGLKTLDELKNLQSLQVQGAKVSEAAVKKLAAALPKCKIVSDHGTFGPTTDPDRRAAEWVLSVGGHIRIRQANQERNITKAAELPAGDFMLVLVNLDGNPQATDSGLAQVKGCKNITWLELTRTPITDAGLAHLKECQSVTNLGLAATSVSDAGLVHLKELKNLVGLSLDGTAVTGTELHQLKQLKKLTSLNLGGTKLGKAGLDHLKDFTSLTGLNLGFIPVTDADLLKLKGNKDLSSLNLNYTQVSDTGMVHIKAFKNLTDLGLTGTSVGNAGLAHVAECKLLRLLDLRGTKVTDAGLAHLKATKNLKFLNLTQTGVSDAGLIHLKELKNLESVTLMETQIGDASIDVIGGWPKLNHVRMQKTEVTDAGAKKLAAKLPSCKIEWNGGVIVPTATADPDRRAAEWVLHAGGHVQIEVGGVTTSIAKDGKLPDRPFQILLVNLAGTGIHDADLAPLKELRNLKNVTVGHFFGTKNLTDACVEYLLGSKDLEILHINGTQITNAGFERLTTLKELRRLHLGRTKINDAGLAHLTSFPKLEHLNLIDLGITDAALSHLRSLTNLELLSLEGTPVTDESLQHLQVLKKLQSLNLNGTKIGGSGLVYLNGMSQLTTLYLDLSPITDDGLEKLKSCSTLRLLGLQGTQVTDSGLEHLNRLNGLMRLNLKKTKVTAAGVKKLAAALPQCKIEWDGGFIEPTVIAAPDRRAAEFVLSIGGAIQVNELPRHITALADLPSRPFELTGVMLPNGKKVTDDDMANFKGCKNLTLLNLGFTHVSDAGMANFKDCTKLTSLALTGSSGLTDAGLAHFKDCKELSILSLYDLKISSVGLAHFKECKKLTQLDLRATALTNASLEPFKDCKDLKVLNLQATGMQPAELAHFRACQKLESVNLDRTIVNDDGLVHLKDLTNLTQLYLNSTRVTDAGLVHLKGLSKLQMLNLKQTKVTVAEVKKLAGALPKCKIESDHGTYGPSAAADPDRRAAESVLSIADPDGHTHLTVRENGKERHTRELPAGPFELTGVILMHNLKVKDADLADLKDCKNLTVLNLGYTTIGDAGVAHFKDCDKLTTLILPGNVTNAGLANFKQCKNLTSLTLHGLRVDDAGLAHFGHCKDLTLLSLRSSGLKDISLKHFKDCKKLTVLDLADSGLNPAELVHFKECKDLTHLDLAGVKTGDKELAYFYGCKNLTLLQLATAKISDKGLAPLKDCKKLNALILLGTGVSNPAVDELRKALPKCNIQTDGGIYLGNRFTNSLGIEFALVPKGKAWFGGMTGTPGKEESEMKEDFYLGVYEVTHAEWRKVMSVNPSHFSRKGKQNDAVKDFSDADLERFPVDNISWDDCQEFLARVNEKVKDTGWKYRMPTEKEWQYACRGGSLPKKEDYAFDFYFDRPTNLLLPDKANFDKNLNRPQKVGSYAPNRLGLYDMHGNMGEWCDDEVKDAKFGSARATRGGGWGHEVGWCRAVFRVNCPPNGRFGDIGVRVARVRIEADGK